MQTREEYYVNIYDNMVKRFHLSRSPSYTQVLKMLEKWEDGELSQPEVATLRHYCNRNLSICKLVIDKLSK